MKKSIQLFLTLSTILLVSSASRCSKQIGNGYQANKNKSTDELRGSGYLGKKPPVGEDTGNNDGGLQQIGYQEPANDFGGSGGAQPPSLPPSGSAGPPQGPPPAVTEPAPIPPKVQTPRGGEGSVADSGNPPGCPPGTAPIVPNYISDLSAAMGRGLIPWPIKYPNHKYKNLGSTADDILSHEATNDHNTDSNAQFLRDSQGKPSIPTFIHETTHGVRSEINNRFSSQGLTGFYIGNSKAAVIAKLPCEENQVAPYVPISLRSRHRFGAYINNPRRSTYSDGRQGDLYNCDDILDEFFAYKTNLKYSMEFINARKTPNVGNVVGPIEGPLDFTVYTLALAQHLIEVHPNYLKKEPNFMNLVSYEVREVLKDLLKAHMSAAYRPLMMREEQDTMQTLLFGRDEKSKKLRALIDSFADEELKSLINKYSGKSSPSA